MILGLYAFSLCATLMWCPICRVAHMPMEECAPYVPARLVGLQAFVR